MSVNSILVHCNIIHSSYMRGTQAPVAYNFFPNAAPGQKILEAPHNLIYLPVTVDVISTLSVWLTDLYESTAVYLTSHKSPLNNHPQIRTCVSLEWHIESYLLDLDSLSGTPVVYKIQYY